jgi:hypothetical protein
MNQLDSKQIVFFQIPFVCKKIFCEELKKIEVNISFNRFGDRKYLAND